MVNAKRLILAAAVAVLVLRPKGAGEASRGGPAVEGRTGPAGR
jgi:hypothetical protein